MSEGQNQTVVDQLDTRIEKKERLEFLHKDFQQVAFEKNNLEQDVENAITRLKSFRDSLDKDGLKLHDKQLREMEKDVAQCQQIFGAANQRYEAMMNEINSLTADLKSFCNVSEDDIIAWQNESTLIKEKVTLIQGAIDQQQKIISKAESSITPLSNYKPVREKLLADIALGEASQDDLDNLDKKIAKEEKTLKNQKAKNSNGVEAARQTIAGLNLKLAETKKELDSTTEKGEELLGSFFVSEAERLGDGFLLLSSQLSFIFARLIALSRLTEKNAEKNIRSFKWAKMLIPSFDLESCGGTGKYQNNGLLFDAESKKASEEYATARECEIEHVIKLAPDLASIIQ